MRRFININYAKNTTDYIFYDTHTDIYRMNFSLPEYVTDQETEIDDDFVCLRVTVPEDKASDLLDFSRDYIIDDDDENTPSKIIEFSTDSDEDLDLPFERYYHPLLRQAISYVIKGNRLLVEFSVD